MEQPYWEAVPTPYALILTSHARLAQKDLYLTADGNVNITTQPYVDAMNFMVETADADYTPSDALATAATESQELFTNGKTAMQINWSHQYPAAVEALGADKVGCAPMIAGSAGIGATTGPWYQCVMKKFCKQRNGTAVRRIYV